MTNPYRTQWWRAESISSKIKKKTRIPILVTFIKHGLGVLSTTKKKKNVIKYEKEVAELSLFVDNMMLYIENSKGITRKLLELINESGKVVEYKINIQKSVAFLYTIYTIHI